MVGAEGSEGSPEMVVGGAVGAKRDLEACLEDNAVVRRSEKLWGGVRVPAQDLAVSSALSLHQYCEKILSYWQRTEQLDLALQVDSSDLCTQTASGLISGDQVRVSHDFAE